MYVILSKIYTAIRLHTSSFSLSLFIYTESARPARSPTHFSLICVVIRSSVCCFHSNFCRLVPFCSISSIRLVYLLIFFFYVCCLFYSLAFFFLFCSPKSFLLCPLYSLSLCLSLYLSLLPSPSDYIKLLEQIVRRSKNRTRNMKNASSRKSNVINNTAE